MQKDIIYIDVDDDITAIIGKIKSAQQKVVALVPPKRVGVLQSAVNMRLLARAAHTTHKRLVLITSNQSLIALAANASIPVARTLQSKPELAEVPVLSVDDGDDIIDGEQLSIGEHARMTDADDEAIDKNLPSFAAFVPPKKSAAFAKKVDKAAPPTPGQALPKPKAKKGSRVPNFDTFRKKLFLGIGLALLLIGFLVWALFFAPRARVIVTAQTTPEVVNQIVGLREGGGISVEDRVLPALFAEEKETTTEEITPTGKKEVGERATGTMTITRQGVSDQSTTLPAGTGFSSGDYTFVTTESVTVPRSAIVGTRIDNGTATAQVRAIAIGPEYNLNARSYESATDGFSGKGSAMSGGSKKEVTVVSQEDVAGALERMDNAVNKGMKDTLKKKLGRNVTVIDESYQVKEADPVVTPAVGTEATEATLTVEMTYGLAGVSNDDLNQYLDKAMKQQLGNANDQHVYKNGLQEIVFAQYETTDSGASVQMTANGQTGPKIDESEVKVQIKGKRYGDVQLNLEAIDGISNVDVKFWPFWVKTVPNDTDRITIEFELNDER